MTDEIAPNKLRTTKWADAVDWMTRSGVEDVGQISKMCSRQHGRHRIGYRNLALSFLASPSGFVRLVFCIDKTLVFETPQYPRDNTKDFGGAARLVTVYTARSTIKGSVEFRLAHHEAVITSATQAASIRPDRAILLAHAEYPSTKWAMSINGDTKEPSPQTQAVYTVVPWISDYGLAGRLLTDDLEAWVEAKPEIDRAPKYVREAADIVYGVLATAKNTKTVASMKW